MSNTLPTLVTRILNALDPRCTHPRIHIDGFREGAKADYRCRTCNRRVQPPGYLEGDYTYSTEGTTQSGEQ